ncbi:MAG TPA: hypothetical protein VGB30_07165 [bacterium]|jgi:3-deoxy-7-phosphoheptulonate synthase
MLIKFSKTVSLDDISRFTERCESLGVHYKFIQERSVSYLVIESAEESKIDELYHQFRHVDSVDHIIRDFKKDNPLDKIEPVKIKVGNRWIAKDHRPVVIAGSPYLESQKHAVELAKELASMGVHLYKGGPYRPGENLTAKALYERSGSIIAEISKKAGIPSTGLVEVLASKVALSSLGAVVHHLPGHLLFETTARSQMSKIGTPVLVERHPEASTNLWLEAAGSIVADGNPAIALVEGGRAGKNGRIIDLVDCARIIEKCPLPLVMNVSIASKSADEVARLSRAALAMGASGIMVDVHFKPTEGLLSDGFCLNLNEFGKLTELIKPLL